MSSAVAAPVPIGPGGQPLLTFVWSCIDTSVRNGPYIFQARSKRALVEYWVNGGMNPPNYVDLDGNEINPTHYTVDQFLAIIDGTDKERLTYHQDYNITFNEVDQITQVP